MAKVIVYKKPNNSIEILRPGCKRNPKETEFQYLSRVAEKTFPGRKYIITDLHHDWNKKEESHKFDSTFRNCWTIDKDGKIAIDLGSAKKIWININLMKD